MFRRYFDLEKKLSHFLKNHALGLLRSAMGLIYFWYGALKIFGISPVEELVERAVYWIPVHDFVVVLGFWEIAIGLCLWIKPLYRIGLTLLFLQFPGTFLPLFLNPEDCFTIIPFGLTLEGQYVFKNLVLLSAGIVLLSQLHPKD
jgi:hypothetical protein